MNQDEMLTMRQVSQALGVKSRVLRRYCNSGMVTGVIKTVGRNRMFTPEQVEQLKVAVWLSRAGFTKKDLRKYILLGRTNRAEAVSERLEMLRTHKRQVWQKLEDLKTTIDFLERQEDLLR